MQDKVTYEYAVIRLVPSVEKEEFINVGVIVFSKRKKYLGIKYHLDKNRIESFSKGIDIGLVHHYLKAWEQVCIGGKTGGPIGLMELPYRFRWLTAYRSTIIQSSRVHPGLCNDPQKVLEELFDLYMG
ncbi:MAG: DUF3037 domain-containing protein [Chitinophagales bacterium]|nr:DUF3037 domain-containing protein [Chitinophagales bacterium]